MTTGHAYEGERYRLTHDVDRYPHFIAPKGALGTVTSVDEHAICLQLDDTLPGAEEWDNEIVWTREDDPHGSSCTVAFLADVQIERED